MADEQPTIDELHQQQQQAQATSPAAPTGLQQDAQAGASDSSIAAIYQQAGYVPAAQSWYTGANSEGVDNGWDTAFAEQFVSGANTATAEGTLGSYFESKDGTGVVLWDHTSDAGTQMNFGDIYKGGEKVGNVYDQFKQEDGGTQTADLMLADWMFTGDEKAAIYAQSNPMQALHTAIEERRTTDTEGWAASKDREAFNADVATNTEEFQSGAGDEVITAGGVAGGLVLTGGAVAATGIGIIPGAIIAGVGGIIGGTAAYLNQDAISQAAGRAYTITSMSREEFGLPAAVGTGIEQWAGVAGKTITPFGNLVEGGFDATHGDVGDGTSEFYRIDETTGGESQVSGLWKTAHIAAAVGDAGLQFASPIGVGMYSVQMGGSIVGQVGGLIGSGGSTFDFQTAQFDNIFTDDNGNFDPMSAAAGIGNIGIDAIQLGFTRGLAGKVDASLVQTGEKALYSESRGFLGGLNPFHPFRSTAGKEALQAGGTAEMAAGQEFIKDAAGNLVSRRATISILAPSEQIMYFSSRIRALRGAAVSEGRAVQIDDFYAAAKSLSEGERKANMILVNAFGEGYEEAVQGVLEPWSHNHAVNWASLAESFAYGAAMGGGMSASAAYHTPSADDKRYSTAATAFRARTGTELTRSNWDSATEMERQNWSALSGLETEQLKAAHTRVSREQTADHVATVAGVDKLVDATRMKQESEAKRAIGINPDAAVTIVPLDDASWRGDAVTASGLQTARNMSSRLDGFGLQEETITRELTDARAALAKNPDDVDATAKVAQLEADLVKVQAALKWGDILMAMVEDHLSQVMDERDYSIVAAESASINDILRSAFDMELNQINGTTLTTEDKMALAKAVSQVKTRDPQDANRSYQVLVPQIDSMLTFWNSHNVVGISQTLLPAIRGDYDGDKVRDQTQLMLSDDAFTTARAGGQFIGAGREVNVAATKTEKEIYRKVAEAMRLSSHAGLKMEAIGMQAGIADALRARYVNVLDPVELDNAIQQFFDALAAGPDSDARSILVNAVANLDSAGALTEFSRTNLSNEWVWISTLVQNRMQEFQRIYASHTPRSGELHPTGADVVLIAADQIVGFELRDGRGLQGNERSLVALTASGRVAGEVTFSESGTALNYGLATVDPSAQGQGLSASLRILFEDYAIRRGLSARFPDVINQEMADGYRARPDKYRETTKQGDPFPSFESTTVAGSPDAADVQAAATRIRDAARRGTTAEPERQATDVGGRGEVAPPTEGQQMAQLLPADTIFRMFQQLHYGISGSRDIAAIDPNSPEALSQMAQLYEALSSKVTRPLLEEVRGKDEINSRVIAMMNILATELAKNSEVPISTAKALALVANFRVVDFTVDSEGRLQPGDGADISLTQFLLKQSLFKWKRDGAQVYDVSPEMQAKFSRLMELTRAPRQGRKGSSVANAERAFVEVFGAQQLYTLLGEDAEGLGQQLTVEQYVRMLSDMPAEFRKAHIEGLHLDAHYKSTEKSQLEPITPPYDLKDIEDKNVETATAFRSVVDSMVSASNSRAKEFRRSSNDVSSKFFDGIGQVRRVLEEYLKVRGGGIQDVESLKALLTTEPGLARRIYDLIPNSAANLALPEVDGKVRVANWVYDMLIEADPQVAEMVYYRNLLLLEWDAVRIDHLSAEGEYGDVAEMKFGDLKRRIHQVMWDLRNNGDGGVLYDQFLVELERPTQTVEGFLEWVNGHPEVLGERAAIVAWHDDVSEFSPDKVNGGWQDILSGAELRLAIRALETTAKGISVIKDSMLNREDKDVLVALKRYISDPSAATPQDVALYRQTEQRLHESARRRQGIGPSAMFYQVVAAARGFYGIAHNKGKGPDHLNAAAAHDATRDQYGGYITDAERLQGAMTSHTLDAVDGNIGLTAGTAGRSMTADGEAVVWDQVTVEEWVDLMSDPSSRKLARSIVSATVLDRDEDGALRTKALHGPSIKALLDGTSYRDLYYKGDEDVTNFDMDLRYLSAVEAEASVYEGHFSVQRALNDLVIARISASRGKLSTEQIEKLTVEAMLDVAKILRTVAAMPVALDNARLPLGEDRMVLLHKTILEKRRIEVNARTLGIGSGDETLTQFAFDSLVAAKETELEGVMQELLAESAADPSYERAVELAALMKAHKRTTEQFQKRFQELNSDNFAGTVVEMYAIPDAAADSEGNARAKSNLIQYVLANPTIRAKVPEALSITNRIFSHGRDWEHDGTMDNISEKEWELLNRAVVAMYVDNALAVSAPSATVSPIPDAAAGFEERMRYYDHTFGYLATPFMDSTSPLLRAARAVHAQSGRLSVTSEDSDVLEVISRRLFKDFSLGTWNSDVVKFSIEAGEGLDSAAGVPAISIYGDLNQRQKVFSAAKHRSYQIPPAGTASTTHLTWNHLIEGTLTSPVKITHPTGEVERPLIQLNNRFASKVVATYMNDQGELVPVDLLQLEHHVGRPFAAQDDAAESGLVEVHLERLRHAVERISARTGIPASAFTIDMEFFHPDMKPAVPGWYNNLFFEGTSFALDADTAGALNDTLNFYEGGTNPVGQGRALDSRKLGVPGLHHVELPTHAEVLMMEKDFDKDLAAVIRAKAARFMATELGGGHLEPEYYNAIYSNLLLRHFVDHVVDGQTVRWTAEQVIAHQLAGNEIVNGKLWLPPDDVLRQMLIGIGGPLKTATDLQVDLNAVRVWNGWTDTLTELFPVTGVEKKLKDTDLVNRMSLRQLQARARLSDVERQKYDARIATRQAIKAQGLVARGQLPDRPNGFNAKANLLRFKEAALNAIRSEDISLSMERAGFGQIAGDRNPATIEHSAAVVEQIVVGLGGNAAGHVYRESWNDAPIDFNWAEGVLTQVSFSSKAPDGMQPLPGDVVLVDLSTFRGDRELAMKRIQHFTDLGLIIVLGEDTGHSNMRSEMAAHMQSLRYESLANSAHAFTPEEFSPRYRNAQAKASGLTSWGGVSKRSRLGILLTDDLGIEENGMWVDPDNEKLNALAETLNIIQSDAFGGFNVPTPAQVDETRRRLTALDTESGRALLLDQSVGHLTGKQRTAAEQDFRKAWKDLMDRVDRQTSSLLPEEGDEFGTGDIIPLVDSHNRIILYRHGHQAPTRPALEDMLKQPLTPDKIDSANVAIYSGSREAAATSHRGTVIEFNPYSHFGLSVNLTVPLQILGDKKVLQWNGLKALLTWRPDRIKLPKRGDKTLPLFRNGFGIDGIASMHDIVSKQGFKDILNNHQVGFWFFGVNFLPDVASFFGVDEATARQILNTVSKMPKISIEDAHYINTQGRASTAMLQAFQTAGGDSNAALVKLESPDSVSAQITLAMVTYLMTPGASVPAVLRSGSFADSSADPNAESVEMPELFTEVFDLAPINSPLRIEMNRRFNDVLEKNPDGTGYVLHTDFTMELRSPDSADTIQGYLQIPEAHSSGDNPVFNGLSYDPFQRSSFSLHSAAMVYQSMNSGVALPQGLKAKGEFLDARAVKGREAALREDGGAYQLLTGIKRDTSTHAAGWRANTPMEVVYKRLINEAHVTFRQPADTSDKDRWSKDEVESWEKMRIDAMTLLGLKRTQVELFDYWVRQMGGRFKDPYNPTTQDEMSGKQALAYGKDVMDNIRAGYFPTTGGEVPAMSAQDVQLIFRANRKARTWTPRESLDNKSNAKAGFEDWDAWTSIALGSVLTADHLFSPIYLAALDGFVQTYRLAGNDMTDLPVSMDVVRALGLMDPTNNKMLISLSPQMNRTMQEAPLLDATRVSLEDILGGQSISGRFKSQAAPTSEIAKRRNARRQWAKKNDVPLAVDMSLKDLKKNGIRLKHETSNTSALMRILINLRVGTALLNPLLYISMGPEQWVRGSLDRTANLLTGQSTVGTTAKLAAKAGLSDYTITELKDLKALYENMGKDIAFKFSIYEALDFLNPVQHGQSRLLRFSEKYASMGALAQDPTRGMSAQTMARRYVEAALQAIAADPHKYRVTPGYVVAKLHTDPMWIEKNLNDVHVMASNAIAQIRSLKSTPLSLMVRGIYEPFAESNHAGWNFFGNLVLKMPLIFSNYAFNVATTITGMQGFSDILAASVQGRQKGPGNIFGRIQSAIKGEEVSSTIDMSEVMEGIDLSRSFIRGGITHTGLFVLGMMAGNLGLSGEDDETKKRRKLAALYGLHPVLDPRRLENDFRNKDAIFLDWLPLGLDHFFEVPAGYGEESRAVAQLPWLMRQFISPIIGMEQFYETGDFSNVTRGFADAIGAFPLINTSMWSDAVETAHTLQGMAKEQEEFGKDENMAGAMWFLTNAVGMYEKMLFENSFVNEIYVAMDRYDRNPYVLPLRDSDGELQRDIEGNVRPNDLALESYIDADGKVQQGYQGRNAASDTLHSLTENRATLAFLTSIFTGGPADSDFNRYNMPVKTRTEDADVATTEEAKAIITAAMQGSAYQGKVMENLSLEEITGELKSTYAAAQNWDAYNNVDVEAKRIYQSQSGAPAALSILDADGSEVLTEAGAFAVLRSLAKGVVNLGDESLAGINITFETRELIQKEWMAELKQEGLDMGLDESAAMKRVNRLWYGPTEDPTIPGIKDFLWSSEISYDKTVTYKQLNTTYVMGPDSRPWATGFRRDNLFNLTGILPLNAAFVSEQSATAQDSRMNTTDLVNGLNTGLRALELVDKSSYIPTDKEIGDSIIKAIGELGSTTGTPFTPYKSNSGTGGYGGGSYGGGGSPFYSKMYAPAGGTVPYGHSLPTINTSNPYIRRASIRRERVWSEKGRLKQWQ